MEGLQSQHQVDETAAQRQARIHRERREAKIKAGGSARLDKITSVSGRPAEPVAAPKHISRTATDGSADPDEVDISSHAYTSAHGLDALQDSAEDDIRRLLRGSANDAPPHPSGDATLPGAGVSNDPFPKLLQHLVGGSMAMAGGRGGQGGIDDQGGLPSGLAAMLGAVGAAGPEQQIGLEGGQPSNRFGYVWTIVHAFSALALGIYMVFTTAFDGAQYSQRDDSGITRTEVGIRFFWAFATAQLVLQSTRYFLERDRGPARGDGWMNMVAGMFPEPWRSRALLLSRYNVIYSTVVQDAMVVVFVLGSVAWWDGAVS